MANALSPGHHIHYTNTRFRQDTKQEQPDSSDYGSDFDDDEIHLLDALAHSAAAGAAKLASLSKDTTNKEDNPISSDVEYDLPEAQARLAQPVRQHIELEFEANGRAVDGNAEVWLESECREGEHIATGARGGSAAATGYPDLSPVLRTLGYPPPLAEDTSTISNGTVSKEDELETERKTKSPLERFRPPHRKPLSVTDLVSPSWCELQYLYTLESPTGRKLATPAMKSGTHVHEKLEAEIYKTVTVDLETREDAWGLKLWNFLQGLRSLEEGGRTRELEVWGTVGGEVVNGVVDEVGWVCPDPDLEREMVSTAETTPGSKEGVMTSPSKRGKHSELPPGQQTLTDFFAQQQTGSSLNNALDKSVRRKRSRSPPTKTKKLYITDTKTRSSTTLPRGAAFRPTKIQLMLYHRLLSDMAAGEVDFQVIADRYGLETEAPFSDSFIAQVGGLEDEVFPSSLTSQTSHGPTDGVTTLLSHNNLSSLWTLLISRLQSLLPARRASIGPILTAEYRSRDTGEVIGSHSFVHDDKVLDLYVDREMEWWKGEREAEGVVVEEAYKCRSCEFADGCHWRNGRIKGAVERARRGWR